MHAEEPALRLAARVVFVVGCPWQTQSELAREVPMLEERKPTEWSREEHDRPVTRADLWYELESVRRTIDAGFKDVNRKFTLLGRKGERAAKFPERGWNDDAFRSINIALNILIVVAWTAFVVVIVLVATR